MQVPLLLVALTSGGPHARIAEMLDLEWPIQPVDPAWIVHLPERSIVQYASHDQWLQERIHHFPNGESFWKIQQELAKAAWEISGQSFPWPPTHPNDWYTLFRLINQQFIKTSPYIFRKIIDLFPPNTGQELKVFVDAQLFISAQTTARYANAFYGSAALDLPRRGVNSVDGGIGSLAETLAEWIRGHGGEIHYRQEVNSILVKNNTAWLVTTNKGLDYEFDLLIANLTPHALIKLFKDNSPAYLTRITQKKKPDWGTFMVYLGLENQYLPEMKGDHHQVVKIFANPLAKPIQFLFPCHKREI